MSLLALPVMFGLMWLLLIRPQQRRMRQHQAVVASLRAGDEVVTAGGVYGMILSVDDETLSVEVAPGVVLRVLRGAVSQRVGPTEDEVDDDGQELTRADPAAADMKAADMKAAEDDA